MKNIILFLCAVCLPYGLWAQAQPQEACGSVIDAQAYEQYKRAVQNEPSAKSRNGQTVTLKLQPHIVRRSNGTGGLSLSQLEVSIQQLNRDFASVGFRFEYCYPNYINDDNFTAIKYNAGVNGKEYQLAVPNLVNDAVNVFFVDSAFINYRGPNNTTLGAKINWASFPNEQNLPNGRNWIFMSNSFHNRDKTLSHEVGHYFNLLHTHQGYRQSSTAERVTRNSSDPCFNCNTTGDLLCDTEADSNLAIAGSLWVQCIYIGGSVDACGRSYQPNTQNIMSYAYTCRRTFTPGQANRMWVALNQYRSGIANSCSSCFPHRTITQPVFSGRPDIQSASTSITASNVIYNGGSATYTAGRTVTLRPGFEARSGSTFKAAIRYCSNGATAQTAPASGTSAATTTSTPVTATEANMMLFPNPATERVELTFFIPADRAFATIQLVNLQGQVVQQTAQQEDLSKGEYHTVMSTHDLPAGIYFVRLSTGQENLVKRLVVLEH